MYYFGNEQIELRDVNIDLILAELAKISEYNILERELNIKYYELRTGLDSKTQFSPELFIFARNSDPKYSELLSIATSQWVLRTSLVLPDEQLRADVDYMAAMMGVNLDV